MLFVRALLKHKPLFLVISALLMAIFSSGVMQQTSVFASTSVDDWIRRSNPISEDKVGSTNGVEPSDLLGVEVVFGVAITKDSIGVGLSGTWDCGKNAIASDQKALTDYASVIETGSDGQIKVSFPDISVKDFWAASNKIVATTINGYDSIDNDNKSRCTYVADLMRETGIISESAEQSRADLADIIATECGPVWSEDKSMDGAEAVSYYNILLMSFSSKDWDSKIVKPYEMNSGPNRCSEIDRASHITSLTPAKLKAELVKACKGNDDALKKIESFTNIQIAKAYSKVKDGKTCKEATAFASTDGIIDEPEEDEYQTNCAVDGIGWVICPLMNFVGKLNDKTFGFLASFLNVEPELFSDSTSQKAWTTFRDLANVAFVIAFLVLIYSQITGGGITNYGIKKMLPKLVIAAILVNVSFIFCQLLVDISNIIGASIYDLFKGLSTSATGGGTESGWSSIIGGILVIGVGVGLLAVVFLAPTVLLVVAMTVIILIARKAILVLLVVISPLAFVAYLLPNTEQWFKKWWKLFWSLLLLYPIVGALFGAGTLASNILMPVAQKEGSEMLQVAALAAMAMPLLAVPSVLKGALSAAGSVGGKLAALQDRANKRGARGIKEGRLGEAKQAWDARKQANRVERRLKGGYFGKGRVGSAVAAYGARRGGRTGRALQWAGAPGAQLDKSRIAGVIGADKGAAAATAAYHSQYKKDVEDHEATMSGLSHSQLEAIYKDTKQSSARRAAAVRMAVRYGGDQHVHSVMDYLGTETDSDMGDIQQAVADDVSKRKPAAYGRTDVSDLSRGKFGEAGGRGKSKSYKQSLTDRAGRGKYGAKEFAGMSDDELVRLSDVTADPSFDTTIHGELVAEIDKYEKDAQLKGNITPERQRALDAIKAKVRTKDASGRTVDLTPVH